MGYAGSPNLGRAGIEIDVRRFSRETAGMTAAGIGALMLLLIEARSGPVPAVKARRIVGLSGARWQIAKEAISPFFDLLNGHYIARPDRFWRPIYRGPIIRPSIPRRVRLFVRERDGDQCRYCGTTSGPFHMDHVKPLSRGGDNDHENIVVACRDCNLSKSDKPLEDWRLRHV